MGEEKKSVYERSLELHEKYKGKMETTSKVPEIKNKDMLSLVYTPGVAEPCRRIYKNPSDVFKYTNKGNLVAVITDNSAVLGLGDLGNKKTGGNPMTGYPVMEGKCELFKIFGKVDAISICLATQNVDEIVETVVNIAPSFGGINLEDISAPRCFEVEEKLKKLLDIPVFHDDQHGTAVVVLAGLINALKIVNKDFHEIKVAMSGAGAAGIAVAKILQSVGVKHIVVCDSKGTIHVGRGDLNPYKMEMAKLNTNNINGSLSNAMIGTDVFIGVSVKDLVTPEMVRTMAEDSIIFAMANPDPEILPDKAKEGGAKVVGTGRSDFPNQVNNTLGFPGIFRGTLDVRASDINEEMKLAAAYALANVVTLEELNPDYVLPSPLDPRVVPAVAEAVAKAAIKSGVARVKIVPDYKKMFSL